MKCLRSDYIITMDSGLSIIRGGCVVMDEAIVEVSTDPEETRVRYPELEVIDLGEGSVLMPGLVNPHVHLEFSGNKTTLEYGDFLPWLYSVMGNREALIEGCNDACVRKAIEGMLASGITTFGAISSYGFDLEACAEAPQRVVYFNEAIGSNPAAVDGFFLDFESRLKNSKNHASERFTPGVAIHSPYSVHPVMVRKVLDLARSEGLPVSAHFMESPAEREWLDHSKGDFKPFFKKFLNTEHSLTGGYEFLGQFMNLSPLYTHGVYINDEELDRIESQGGTVVHCPVSNRLLGCGQLDLERLKAREIPYAIATDGLSSNYDLNLFKEMRTALFQQSGLDLALLARDLLTAATRNGSRALGLNGGSLEAGKDADVIVLRLPDNVEEERLLPLQVVLHCSEAESVYIKGEQVR